MNEQLQVELTKIVTNINNGTDSAWEFISAQTPDVVRQLLLWHGIKSLIAFCLAIVFMIAGFIITARLFKYSRKLSVKSKERYKNSKYDLYNPTPFFVMWFVPLIICIFATLLAIFENLTWLKIWLAPKIWLLEYIISMVK